LKLLQRIVTPYVRNAIGLVFLILSGCLPAAG
jgi:hypothetical protein